MIVTSISLTDHRIDVKFSDYISKALNCTRYLSANTTHLIVTNGMIDSANPKVLKAMKELPSIYLIDDHTCWIPDLIEYPLCTIYSQFTEHPTDKHTPMKYFQVSKLALFDELFSVLEPRAEKQYDYVYWGKYKKERHEQYFKYLRFGTYVIGKNYPKELGDRMVIGKFTKDLDVLNKEISKGAKTKIFGDEFHDGVNLPYRIYEALMNCVQPEIARELLGTQEIPPIGYIMEYIEGTISSFVYKKQLDRDRQAIVDELDTMLNDLHYGTNMVEANECLTNDVNSVTDILKERGKIYGSYVHGVHCRATIMEALNELHIDCNGKSLEPNVQVVFSDLVLKLMRAASSPSHSDSWLDLAGYAKLINDMVEEQPDEFHS